MLRHGLVRDNKEYDSCHFVLFCFIKTEEKEKLQLEGKGAFIDKLKIMMFLRDLFTSMIS